MTNIGVFSLPATGHLNTILPLAQELQQRGHEVTVFGIPDIQKKVEIAGLPFQGFGASAFPLGWLDAKYTELGKSKGKEAKWHSQNLRQALTTILLEEAPQLLQNLGVEALIVDNGEKGGGTVSEHLKLPFVTICTALIPERHSQTPLREPVLETINNYRQRWNLSLYKTINDCLSSLAQISQQPAQFDIPRTSRTKLPDCFHFTGPFHTKANRIQVDFPWSKIAERPLIYASMGTLQNRLSWIFQIISKACVDLEVQLVISLGGGMDSQAVGKLSGNPLVVQYAPQLDLLDRASLTITHGGLNTTLESLSRGVPLIAIPIAHDQLNVAHRLQWKGAGVAISLRDLTVNRLHDAISQVLSTKNYYDKAAQLQKAIANSGGVRRAGDIVERAFASFRESMER